MMYRISMARLGGVPIVAALAIASGAASAADITLMDATIAGGRLLVSGTTAVPNTEIRLDGQTGNAFNVRSDASRSFAFELVYHPGDCVVTLQRVTPPYGTLSAPVEGLVGNCGRDAVSWRGAWSEAMPYAASDLVTYEGSAWRARRNNIGRTPRDSADWEIFAAGASEDAVASRQASPRVEPTGPAGGDLAGNYPNPSIRNGVVDTAQLAAGAVTRQKIEGEAINTAKLALDAVTSDRILDGSVGTLDLAPDAVSTDRIANGAVGTADIGIGAVNGGSVLDDSLTSADLATNAVGALEVADAAIDSGEIADNTLSSSDLAANSVTASEIAPSAVTSGDIANNTITTADILGADTNGSVDLSGVPNGRCSQVSLAVSGAIPGQVALLSVKGSIQAGILFYAQRVEAAGTVMANICNFSCGAMTPITNLPVRVITFG